MAHAEKCPVCDGIGRTEFVEGGSGTTVRKLQPCHGCGGKGWIEVSDPQRPIELRPWDWPYPGCPHAHQRWIYSGEIGL
ncbi:hypothetical protein KAR91_43735 [Candidatus Pacearchaeota archaeon]|nr:hypothetical protein [Candidatus Pacearchaeota archaeon]